MNQIGVWTADEVERLRQYWNVDGFTATEISYRIPAHSRNSVISKVHRLKLARRRIGANGIRKEKKHRAAPDRILRRKLQPILPGDLKRLRGAAWEALPGATPVSLIDLETGMCRWPIGEGKPFLFCGHPSDEGKPYCTSHAALSQRSVDIPTQDIGETGAASPPVVDTAVFHDPIRDRHSNSEAVT